MNAVPLCPIYCASPDTRFQEYRTVLRCVVSLSVVSTCLSWCCAAWAVSPPSETLLPNTTKGFLSVPNVDLLRENFKLTQAGELITDPVMKPFMDDLGGQLEEK